MNIHLHMTHTWIKMQCSKMQQASGGFQLPLQACVYNQEVTRLLQRKGITYRKTQAHLKP